MHNIVHIHSFSTQCKSFGLNRIIPGSSTPVSSTAVSSTPISSTDVLSTLFFQCNNLCRSSLYCLLMYYVKVRGQITKGKTCFATS